MPTGADRCRHRRADRRAAGKLAGRVSGTAGPGTRSRGAACLRAYPLPLVPVSQSLPKGAQRVAARVGVGSVHVEPGCAFSGRRYVAYAAPGFWFPSVECQTVIASTVAELSDYARPEPEPVAEPVAEPIEPTARAAWHAAPAGVDVVPFAWVSDAVRFETGVLFDARRYARSGAADGRAVFDTVADGVRWRVADAVAVVALAPGNAADAVAVVALAPGNAADAATLRFAGVSYVLAGDGALMASHAGGAPRGFDTIADAVAHAGGRTRPVLPGEILPPAAPTHGDRAPVLPVL